MSGLTEASVLFTQLVLQLMSNLMQLLSNLVQGLRDWTLLLLACCADTANSWIHHVALAQGNNSTK